MKQRWVAGAAVLVCLTLLGGSPGSQGASPALSPTASPDGASLPGMLGAYPDVPSDPVPTAVAEELQGVLEGLLDVGGGVPDVSPGGITAAVIAPGCGVWTGATGHRVGDLPMTSDTQMLVASVTKTVAAAAVLRLVEQGLVDLDAPIADYLPSDLAFDTNGATVRQVLRMRSGIGEIDEASLVAQALVDPDIAIDRASVLATVPAPTVPADTVSEYRDSNYILLGTLIEHVTGTSIAAALRTLVLRDAGLTRLVFQDEERPQGPVAVGYIDPSLWTLPGLQAGLDAALERGYIPSRSLASVESTAAAVAADAATLARWGYLLYGGFVVSDASLALMTDFDSSQRMDWGMIYGMGSHDMGVIGSQGLGHVGWWMGYLTVLLTRPESGVTVVALVNDERLQDFWAVPRHLATIAETC